MKKSELIGALFLFVFGGIGCFEALKLEIGTISNPKTGFFPFLLAVGLLLISGVLIIKSLSMREEKSDDTPGFWEGVPLKKILLVVGGMVLYGFLLEPLGYLIATTLLIAFLFKVARPQRWRWLSVFVWSAGISIITYVLFKVWLQVQFPVGLLAALI